MFYPANSARLSIRQPLFDKLEQSPCWIAEPLISGIHCLAYHHHKRIDLWTRRLLRISAPLIELRKQLMAMLPDQTTVEGVLIGPTALKDRLCIFDIPILKGQETGRLFERYNALIGLYDDQPLIEIVRQTVNKRAFFYKNKPFGIILKDLSSYYIIGTKRGKINPYWIKIYS